MKEKVRIDDTGHVLNVMTEDGAEIPDPTPMAPALGFKRQPPLHERIRAMVQHEYNRVASEKAVETMEEADDFIIDSDDDDPREGRFALMPGSEWEDNYDPPADFKEMKDRLVAAGWTPPSQENSATDNKKSDASANSLDASKANNKEEPRRGSDKQS